MHCLLNVTWSDGISPSLFMCVCVWAHGSTWGWGKWIVWNVSFEVLLLQDNETLQLHTLGLSSPSFTYTHAYAHIEIHTHTHPSHMKSLFHPFIPRPASHLSFFLPPASFVIPTSPLFYASISVSHQRRKDHINLMKFSLCSYTNAYVGFLVTIKVTDCIGPLSSAYWWLTWNCSIETCILGKA